MSMLHGKYDDYLYAVNIILLSDLLSDPPPTD